MASYCASSYRYNCFVSLRAMILSWFVVSTIDCRVLDGGCICICYSYFSFFNFLMTTKRMTMKIKKVLADKFCDILVVAFCAWRCCRSRSGSWWWRLLSRCCRTMFSDKYGQHGIFLLVLWGQQRLGGGVLVAPLLGNKIIT